MRVRVRYHLIIFLFFALIAVMSLVGAYRYSREKEVILADARLRAEQSGKLIAEVAAPLLMTYDYDSLQIVAGNFMRGADAREIVIVDSGGREIVRAAGASLAEKDRIVLEPFQIVSDQTRLGEMRLAVYPAGLAARLRSHAAGAVAEVAFIFCILAAAFYFYVKRTIIGPLREMGGALKDVIDRKDFRGRVVARRNDELGALAAGMNDLIKRLDQIVGGVAAIAARIGDISPRISSAIKEIQHNADIEEKNIASVVASAGILSSSVKTVAESAESLSTSAEGSSSAMLEMNASNQEVLRHTTELTSSVEDVTTSVMEMIASIREVAAHAETLSSASDETAASANEIETTVREVEQAARESARLSQQVSVEARNIGVSAIEQTTNAMNRIKDSVTSYSGLVARLGKRSEEIGKILAVIVEVTERTNLLALNASILAAQAGEHGRGFSVVAEEIKALADRTAGSAQDITKLISSVQKETREALAAMTDSLSAVEEGVSRSEDARAALGKILTSSARSAEMANMIERATAEQSRGIRQVGAAIDNIKQMTSQIASATQAQTAGTELIMTASEGMRDIALQVHHAMTEQERGGKQIAEAAENVSVRAGRIASSTRDQREAGASILDAMERVQDLPRQNKKRLESLVEAVKGLEEQTGLLDRELPAMTARKLQEDAGN